MAKSEKSEKKKSKWFMISNRLPFQYDSKTKKLKEGQGGLITAIQGIKAKSQEIVWVGTMPESTPKDVLEEIKGRSKKGLSFYPVIIKDEVYNRYYNGLSNDLLWPLFHYEFRDINYRTEDWRAYKLVNQIFAKEASELIKPDDLVWIHDFHFFLLPQYLRERKCQARLGFFLHIPFPSSEIYRQLPIREELLRSILNCDLIGFHDYSYLRHFSSSLHQVLGVQSSMVSVREGKRLVNFGVYPVSIDSADFKKRARSKEVQKIVEEFAVVKKGMKIILGVDRLDYTKGIDLKLKSFQYLLQNYEELRGKVQLIQVAVPSRTDVPEYIRLKKEVDELIGEINGEFSTPTYSPIQYIFNSVPWQQLHALYQLSNVLCISSKRDGMNLVSLEYIISQNPQSPGVVVLSEFAGAISTLTQAISINPHDIPETAKALFTAIKMPLAERKERYQPMAEFLDSYTATTWASAFMDDLGGERTGEDEVRVQTLRTEEDYKRVCHIEKNAKTLFFLDYDGTLAAIHKDPNKAILSKDMQKVLKTLRSKKNFKLVIVSGRPIAFLKKHLIDFDIDLAGEHGAELYDHQTKTVQTFVSAQQNSWTKVARKMMADYQLRTPGSFIEEKRMGLGWHYRQSTSDLAEFQARRLMVELEQGLMEYPVKVIKGKKVIEVKPSTADKGTLSRMMQKKMKDIWEENFKTVVLGDDFTDEDMFRACGENDLSVKIGTGNTEARYRLPGQENVGEFLSYLAKC